MSSAGADPAVELLCDMVRLNDEDQLRAQLRRVIHPPAALSEPLATAAASGNTAIIRLLLEYGAPPDSRHPKFGTALMCAIRSGHVQAVQVLLEAGANVNVLAGNIMAGEFVRPLQEAAVRGLNEIVKLLLAAGADPETVDGTGRGQAMFQAANRGYEDTARLIYDHVVRARERKAREHFESHGFTILPDRSEGEIGFRLTGTQGDAADVDAVMRKVVDCATASTAPVPFTEFDGWLKQLDRDCFVVMTLEALDSLFPTFSMIHQPDPKYLPNLPHVDGESIRFARERRFAGDHLLPRGRYYTLCDEAGNDDRTLCNELFAYRDVRVSGELELFDPYYPADKARMVPPWNTKAVVYADMRPVGDLASAFSCSGPALAAKGKPSCYRCVERNFAPRASSI